MFNTVYQVYPMGFRSPLSEGVKSQTDVDFEIVQLYKEFKTGKRHVDSFEFRKKVIQATRRLLGFFPEWLDAQDKNTKISESAYELLVDTIEFINTGNRPIALEVRMGIMATEQLMNTYENAAAAGRTTKLRDLLLIKPDEVIFTWINHRDGFFDMLCTIHSIFGLNPRG